MFTINNLDKLDEISLSLKDIREFKKLFEVAEVGKLNQKDMNAYQHNLKIRRDNYAADQYAKELATEKGMAEGLQKGLAKGLEEGLAEGKHKKAVETARQMLAYKEPIDKISLYTKLAIHEIEAPRG